MKIRLSETNIKGQTRDYLSIKGIFNYPLLQGVASYKGLPDRVMHLNGQVHYLEIKRPTGKLSSAQEEFQQQCQADGIPYHVIRCIEELQKIVEI